MTREQYENLDKKVSEKKTDENGRDYYMCNGEKYYAMDCKTEEQRRTEKHIMRFRASGYDRPSDMLRDLTN